METLITSPYQRTKTPQQVHFWSNYINKDLETFGNSSKEIDENI